MKTQKQSNNLLVVIAKVCKLRIQLFLKRGNFSIERA
jgi:hypothetical protein